MIVFVSLSLSAGMPLITVVSFFALWFRYLYLKYIFIRYCKVPKTYDEALDTKVSGLIPYSVCIHFMFGIWMFGVTTIFNSDSSSINSWVLIFLLRWKIWITPLWSRLVLLSQESWEPGITLPFSSWCLHYSFSSWSSSTWLPKILWKILRISMLWRYGRLLMDLRKF